MVKLRAWTGWAGIAGLVLFFDLIQIKSGGDTLSHSYYSALQGHPIPVLSMTTYLVLHLCKQPKFLEVVDPLHILAKLVENEKKVIEPKEGQIWNYRFPNNRWSKYFITKVNSSDGHGWYVSAIDHDGRSVDGYIDESRDTLFRKY